MHRRKFRATSGRTIRFGRYIDDDQPFDALRMPNGDTHRHFTAHAVPDKISPFPPLPIHPGQNILHQVFIGHGITMRRLTVIAQVQGQHMPVLRQSLARTQPVP